MRLGRVLRQARHGLLLLFLAFPLAFPIAPAAAEGVFDPATFTLDNGMKVVVVTNTRAPVVTHMVWYRVGAMDEPPGKSGLAHFLEHLMFKGTESLGPNEFSQIVARHGGQENAFTSQDYTAYYQTIAKEELGMLMEHEADRMVNLRMAPADIESEREVVLEERRSRTENEPSALLREQMGAALYLNHPYRLPIIGWAHEIRTLTHEDIIGFYKQWYRPNNATLVIAGDVTMAEVRPLAEKTYGKIAPRELPPRPRYAEPPHLGKKLISYAHEQVREPEWARRVIAPSHGTGGGEDVYALTVLSEIMSGGQTSRLYRTLVVEQGIAASAGAWYDGTVRGPGVFGLYGVPRGGTDIEALEKGVDAVVAKLLEDGVTQAEVDHAVSRLQADAIYARDSLRTPAQVFGEALSIGLEVEDVEAWPERIGAVTVEDVNRVAREVLGGGGAVTSLLLPINSES